MIVYTYRYMWRLKDSATDLEHRGKICFKIVSDVLEGLKSFEDSLISSCGDDLFSFGKEYLHEYDVSKVGVFESLYKEGK